MKFTKLFGLLQILGSIMTGENIVIILSIISIVVAIIFGMPAVKTWRFEKKKDELKQKLLFKEGGWLNASQLTYSSLDFIRVMKDEQKPTSQAGIIESIRDIIDKRKEKEEQNHILLVGPSLSGKSHITVSVLKSLDDAYVLIPNEDTFNQSTKDGYELPDAPANARYKIILLDNFHEFFKGSASTPKALIHEAIDKGFTLWANCISVEEYARVNSYLDFKDGYLGLFTEIDLCKRITSEEATIIAKGLGIEILPASFNGIIGEIFYRPSDMIQHYEELKSDVVALDVLIFIKQTYILGAFTSPYLIRLELLKQAFTKKYSPDFITLMSALKKIEQKGFIKLLNDHTYISFESVWLNEIVEPEMRASEFFSFWKDIIPRNNYETALERYDKIEKGKADVIVYNSIISKSPNYETAVEWYNKIENGKADVFTYNPIISKSPNYETALEWYRKIEKGTENAITYSSLITKSPNYKTALEWYNKIEKGAATTITYNSLIDKSPNYNAALEWYNKIEKGSATTITYNSLISKSPNFETALEWYSKIEKGDETTITYNSLIDKSPNYETAVEWYNKIEDDKANVFTCTLLIGKSPNYETALQWSNKIEKGQANVFTYSTLIGKSPNYETALKWFSKIEIGTATTNAYNCLISKCPNYETAIEWYNKIENGQADLFTFNCLISKCPNYETAIEWYNKIEKGQADLYTFNSLISKSPNYETAIEWYNKIEKGQADSLTYNTLMSKSPDFNVAISWLRKMETERVPKDEYSYGGLIRLVSRSNNINSYQLAISLHDEMLEIGIPSNVAIFTLLISLAPNFEQAYKLLELMITKKDKSGKWILPNERTKKAMENKTGGKLDLLNKVKAWFE